MANLGDPHRIFCASVAPLTKRWFGAFPAFVTYWTFELREERIPNLPRDLAHVDIY